MSMDTPASQTPTRGTLTDEEIDLLTEPIRTNVTQASDGRWTINGPLLDVVTTLGEACEKVLAARTTSLATLVEAYAEETHSDECGIGACVRCVVDEFAARIPAAVQDVPSA